MYTFDTNVVIYFIRNEPAVVARVREILAQTIPYLSTITELELFAFPTASPQETADLEAALEQVSIIPLSSQVARIAATLRKDYGMKLPDSAIAATSLVTNSILLTRNVRDFKKAPMLSVERI